MARRIYGRSRHRKDLILGGLPYADWIKTVNGISPLWDFQELVGSVAAAWNTQLTLGRNVAVNGDFANWTGIAPNDAPDNWNTTQAGDATSNITQNPAGSCQIISDGTFAGIDQPSLVSGIEYQITLIISDVTLGAIEVDGFVGTHTFSTTGTKVFTDVANTSALVVKRSVACNVTIPSIKVQQTDILPSSSYPTPGTNPLDGDHTAVTVGVPTGNSNIPYAVTYNGGTSFTDIYSAELNSMFNPESGTLMVFAKVSGAGVWTDGAARNIFRLDADGSGNLFDVRKHTVNNALIIFFRRGSIASQYTIAGMTTTDYFNITITWDSSNFYTYLDGVLLATTANAGLWVGNLLAANTTIGALSTIPTSVWDGDIAYPMLANRALTPAEIAEIWNRSGF